MTAYELQLIGSDKKGHANILLFFGICFAGERVKLAICPKPMNVFSYPAAVIMVLCTMLCCSPRPYTPVVMVRPATCSHDVQFAECATLGHLLQFADKMRKPIFLHFYMPWLDACTKMDQWAFKQDEVASYFNTNFINYKVNAGGASPGPDLAYRYGITTYPTQIFLDGKGKVMFRNEGYVTAAQLLEMGYFLTRAVEKEMVSVGGQ